MSDLISRKEIIDRLERVIQNGVPSEDGMHPISAETVLEVVKELSEHGTNLAEVGTDCISRQAAIDALRGYLVGKRCPDDGTLTCRLIENEVINKLPPAQPERIKGHWIDAVIPNDNGGLPVQVCDQCNTFFPLAYTGGGHSFCPHCGADMREVTT